MIVMSIECHSVLSHNVFLLSRPNTLILQFKRMKTTSKGTVKNSIDIDINKLITLEPFISCTSPCYSIGSVVNHTGEGWSDGHYITYRLSSDGTWIKYNDSGVSICQPNLRKAYTVVYNLGTDKNGEVSANFDAVSADGGDVEGLLLSEVRALRVSGSSFVSDKQCGPGPSFPPIPLLDDDDTIEGVQETAALSHYTITSNSGQHCELADAKVSSYNGTNNEEDIDEFLKGVLESDSDEPQTKVAVAREEGKDDEFAAVAASATSDLSSSSSSYPSSSRKKSSLGRKRERSRRRFRSYSSSSSSSSDFSHGSHRKKNKYISKSSKRPSSNDRRSSGNDSDDVSKDTRTRSKRRRSISANGRHTIDNIISDIEDNSVSSHTNTSDGGDLGTQTNWALKGYNGLSSTILENGLRTNPFDCFRKEYISSSSSSSSSNNSIVVALRSLLLHQILRILPIRYV